MKIKYELSADDIKEAVAVYLRQQHEVRLDWQDVDIVATHDTDDRSGIRSTTVVAIATVESAT